MTTFEYSIPASEAIAELNSQFRLLKYAIKTLEPHTQTPDIRDAYTLLDNMQLAVELYLDELKQLCPTLPSTTSKTSPLGLPSGNQEKQKLTGYQLPLPIAS